MTHDLFARFRGPIYGYCLNQLGSREEAEDAMQTTFMNALRSLQRGIVPRVEAAWLFKIAQNVCLSRRRSARRRGRIETPTNFDVLQEVVPARERTSDELIRLHEVLEQMPAMQRRAILMREWRGLSYREIAAALQVSQAAVEALVFRARRALAAGLAESVPKTTTRKRARYGFDASGLVAALKAIFGGGTAVKMGVTVVAVATTSIASADVSHRPRPADVGRHEPPSASTSASNVVRSLQSRVAVGRRAAPTAVRSTPRRSASERQVVHATATGGAESRPRPLPREATDAPTAAASVAASGAPVLAASDPPAMQAPAPSPPAPAPPAEDTEASATPSPSQSNAGRGNGGPHDDTAAPSAVDAPALSASQASDDHGRAAAPGQQDKAGKPDKSKKSGA